MPTVRGLVLDAIALAGLTLIGIGCWWIYPPAAFLAIGSLMIGLAVVLGRR